MAGSAHRPLPPVGRLAQQGRVEGLPASSSSRGSVGNVPRPPPWLEPRLPAGLLAAQDAFYWLLPCSPPSPPGSEVSGTLQDGIPDAHNLKEEKCILAHGFSPRSAGWKAGTARWRGWWRAAAQPTEAGNTEEPGRAVTETTSQARLLAACQLWTHQCVTPPVSTSPAVPSPSQIPPLNARRSRETQESPS